MLNSAKHNPQSSFYQSGLEKDQYLANFSFNDQFAIDIKNNNEDNKVVARIEGLFLNIGYKSSYKRLIEKMVQETCKLFMHFARHMSSKDRVAPREIRSGLRPF